MEHGLAMTRLILILLMVLTATPPLYASAGDRRLVLVAGAQSLVPALSADEVRKLYLGMPMMVAGYPIHPLRNNADETVQEMFMQKVMFMSTPAYERQILGRVFRAGGNRPQVYTETQDLVKELENDRTAISYLPKDVALATPGLKIVGEP